MEIHPLGTYLCIKENPRLSLRFLFSAEMQKMIPKYTVYAIHSLAQCRQTGNGNRPCIVSPLNASASDCSSRRTFTGS